MAETSTGTLPAAAVEERLRRLEGLLERIEQLPGAIGELAMDAVTALTEVYGTALGRVIARLDGLPEVVASLADDELLHHLLVLHGIHPLPPEERAARAVEEVRGYARSHGGDIELVEVAGDVVRVRLSGSCSGCASSSATLERLVSDAVLAAVPEVSRVEAVAGDSATPQPAFIPVTAVRRPAVAR